LSPPRIAVNVSPRQLRQQGFIDSLLIAIEDFADQLPALDIEVTESAAVDDIQNAVKKLQIVRGLGVDIAIDDFGTGYSSLGYIAKLPVNAVKIDRSFVIEMGNNEYCRNIVTLIVSLAHTLKLKVIAEGVDDPEHVRILRDIGCDEMQGFLISKPLPPEGVAAYIASPPLDWMSSGT
jgi:EAL domain-containing protein (putative c-di-GMP-specific phosphodiesterase class I)